MQKTLSIAAILLASTAQFAFSQGLDGITHQGTTFTFGFNWHNEGGEEPYSENYTKQFTAQSSYNIGNGLGATFTLGYSGETYAGDFWAERYLLDVNPTFDIGNGKIGAYYTAISYNDGGKESHSSYGVTADLELSNIDIEAYAGVYNAEGEEVNKPFGIAASYPLTSDLAAYVSYQIDVFTDETNEAALALGSVYDLSGIAGVPIRLRGEISLMDDFEVGFTESNWTQFSLFASYDVGGNAGSIFRGLRSFSYDYD